MGNIKYAQLDATQMCASQSSTAVYLQHQACLETAHLKQQCELCIVAVSRPNALQLHPD